MRKRKIFVANLSCGMEMSFEIFEDGSVTMGGEPDDSFVRLGPGDTQDMQKHDVTELFVVFRELLKEAKKK